MLSYKRGKSFETIQSTVIPQEKPSDFDAYWESMLLDSANQPLNASSELVPYPVPTITVEKASFDAFDGGRIVGWLISPKLPGLKPALVFFHGYGGHRGKVHEYLLWALQGFTVFTIDVRGQNGESSDLADYPGGRTNGWMSWGLLEPRKYYLARAYVDTVRAVSFVAALPAVDEMRIGVAGVSQGGALALAAASLDKRPALCLSEVPGFCHFVKSIEGTRAAPWHDLTGCIQQHPENTEAILRTLSYVELNNLTERIQCPTLVSVGLLDDICLPETIFSAFNRIPAAMKRIDVFPFNGHEGYLNREAQIEWARRHLLGE